MWHEFPRSGATDLGEVEREHGDMRGTRGVSCRESEPLLCGVGLSSTREASSSY